MCGGQKLVSKEDILKDKELYWNSVLFFAAFSTYLDDKKIDHKIEHEVIGEDKNPKYPDFILFKNKQINGIIEHKSSFPVKQEFALKIIEETYNKYHKIFYNDAGYNPPIVILCPKTCEEVIRKIKKLIKKDILICVFDLDKEDCKVFFSLSKQNYPNHIKELLSEEIPCRMDDFSKFRFIKKEPHTVYTAWNLWCIVLNYFKNPYTIKKDSMKVSYNNLVEQASTLFPPWIENKNQITRKRINGALIFLNKIGFINWKMGETEIEFFHNKGSKIGGDIFEYFAKKWVEIIKLKPEKKKINGQKGLKEFF